MSNNSQQYTKLDEHLDKYLGTNNLRPGPSKKLISQRILGIDETNESKYKNKIEYDMKTKINFNSNSMELNKINWSDLVGVQTQATSSNSIFYLQFINNRLLLLKASTETPSLLFSNIISKSFLIDTPNCRVIEYLNPEYKEMMKNIKRVTTFDKSFSACNVNNKITKEIEDKLFILLYEYIPSISLFDFNIAKSQKIFSEKNHKSREIFISIGKVVGLDILLNNNERLPLIWDNIAKVETLLFKVNPDSILPNCDFKDCNYLDVFLDNAAAFDTRVFCLNPDDKFDLKKLGEYLNRISEFMKEFFYTIKHLIFNGGRIESLEFKYFKKISETFHNTSKYYPSNQNLFHLSIGLIVMLDDIARVNIEDVDNVIKFVQNKAISKDWADSFKANSKLLSTDYFKYIISYFKQIRNENEEMFNWVDDITQGYYSSDFSSNYMKEIQTHEEYRYNDTGENSSLKDKDNIQKLNEEKNINSISQVNSNEDDFNFNRNDKKKFRNDVHNGIYDVMNIDDKMILEVVKREFIQVEKEKEIEVTDLKIDVEEKNDSTYVIENNNSFNFIEKESQSGYKKYTIEELKDKIKRDELKETLNIKKNFNPEEGKFLEEKIKEVDEDFFKDSKSNFNNEIDKQNLSISYSNDNASQKSFANTIPKKRDEK